MQFKRLDLTKESSFDELQKLVGQGWKIKESSYFSVMLTKRKSNKF